MSVRSPSAARALAAALLVTTFTACASLTVVRPERSWRTAPDAAPPEGTHAAALAPSSFPIATALPTALAPMPLEDETRSEPPEPMPRLGGDSGYTRFSVGAFMPDGDIDALDDGYYAQIAFGRELMPFLAVEASVGYLNAEGDPNLELWAIPVLLNGRLQLPILIFELYGGIGIGGMYADYDLGAIDDSDFVLAGTAFVGAEVGVDNLAVGVEYRYLASEEIDTPFGEFQIEGHCLLLTLSFPF